MLITSGFYVGHEYLVGEKRFHIFHLVCKDICFMSIFQIIVDHAPYRCFTRAGYKCHYFNRVLPIKYIIDAIAAADLNRVYLIQIKIGGCFLNVLNRKVALVILIGNKIFNWNLFKMHIRHENG